MSGTTRIEPINFGSDTWQFSGKTPAAYALCGNIRFYIDDPFAAYLGDRRNPELYDFLVEKAIEIRKKIAEMEARVGVVPPESANDGGAA